MLPTILLGFALHSTVAEVVVYPDRAQVLRAVEVDCQGAAVVPFESIPPAADATSFRARTPTPGAAAAGLRAEEKTRADAYGPDVRDTEDKLRSLERDAQALNDERSRAEEAARLGGSLTDVTTTMMSRELVDGAPNVKAWGGALDQAAAARSKAQADLARIGAKQRLLQRQIDELRRKRARLATAAARHEWRVEVEVTCAPGRTTRVELSYTVGGASWSPAYEARADEAGGTVELATWATVRQATGEPWKAARVILSTAVPHQDATPPEIQPYFVAAEERKPPKKVLVRREELHEHAEAADQDQASGAPAGGLVARSQGVSVQLVVPEPSDVAGDDTPARLLVGRTTLKAHFAYRTAPALAPFVYRVADLTNTAAWPLEAGPLDVYRRGSLSGRAPLERVPIGGRFHLTFGLDENLRVKRTVLEEVRRDTGLFGSTRRFRYGYRFEVANWTSRPEEIEVADRVPVIELDDVKMAIDPQTTAGWKLAADDGVVTWRVTLAPGEKRTIDLAYHVDAPSSYDTGGM